MLCGLALAALGAALTWHGLWYLVAHASGARPDHLAADIIVPLAGSPERIAYAAALQERGIGSNLGSTLVDIRCRRVRGDGERCATGVRNTVDEAILLRRLFEEEHIATAIVVTSPSHLARATAVFSVMFAGTGIDVRFVGTPDAGMSNELVAREAKSYLPSLGAAVLARVSLSAYEWGMQVVLRQDRRAAASRHLH